VVKAMSDQLGPSSGEPALSPDKLAAVRFEFDNIRDQLNQIRQAKDGIVCRMKLKVGQTAGPDCFPPLTIR
jgi:hypothetical protein